MLIKCGEKTMSNEVLLQLSQGNLRPNAAYKELYGTPKAQRMGRAHFVKLRIRIPEEKGISRFLAFLFLCPVPLFIVRMFIKKMKPDAMGEKVPLSPKEIMELISYKGIIVEVKAKDGTNVLIKTL